MFKAFTWFIHSFIHSFHLLHKFHLYQTPSSVTYSRASIGNFLFYLIITFLSALIPTSSYFFYSKQYFLSTTSITSSCPHFLVLCIKTLEWVLFRWGHPLLCFYFLFCSLQSDFVMSLHSSSLWWNRQHLPCCWVWRHSAVLALSDPLQQRSRCSLALSLWSLLGFPTR